MKSKVTVTIAQREYTLISDEGEAYWFPLSELQNRPLPSGFPEMLPLFLRDDLSETYHFLEDGEWRCENL